MSRNERYLRRLGVCCAWACFIISCALWVWAEAPRGPSVSFRLSDPDGGMIPKAPTKEEAVQMAQVNREFAALLRQVRSEQLQVVAEDDTLRKVCKTFSPRNGRSHQASPSVILLVSGR